MLQRPIRAAIAAVVCLGGTSVTAAEIPGWRFHGATRAAAGFADSSSKAGMSFATADLFMTFSARARAFVTLAELEGASARIEGSGEQQVAAVRRAYVGLAPEGKPFALYLGRMTLDGATRLGTESATRRNDEAFGRIEGLKIENGGEHLGYRVGIVAGNTLGLGGASSSLADQAMTVDVTAPGARNAPKASRAGVLYAEGCRWSICLDLWYGLEKDHFTKAPTLTPDDVAKGTTPDGVVYKSLKHAEGGLRYTATAVNVGGWYRRIWLKDPRFGALQSNGGIATGEGNAGNSSWSELYGIGVEYSSGGIAANAPDAPGHWFTGLAYVAHRAATDGLGKESEAAKAEDDRDLKQVGLSLGWRELPATLSLNVVLTRTAGDAMPAKSSEADKTDKRTVVYSAFSFVL